MLQTSFPILPIFPELALRKVPGKGRRADRSPLLSARRSDVREYTGQPGSLVNAVIGSSCCCVCNKLIDQSLCRLNDESRLQSQKSHVLPISHIEISHALMVILQSQLHIVALSPCR